MFDREEIGKLMHASWSKTKREQRFHGPDTRCERGGVFCGGVGICPQFHADLIPWEALPEKQKDINRHAVDAVLPYFEKKLANAEAVIKERDEDLAIQSEDHNKCDEASESLLKRAEAQMGVQEKLLVQAVDELQHLHLKAMPTGHTSCHCPLCVSIFMRKDAGHLLLARTKVLEEVARASRAYYEWNESEYHRNRGISEALESAFAALDKLLEK